MCILRIWEKNYIFFTIKQRCFAFICVYAIQIRFYLNQRKKTTQHRNSKTSMYLYFYFDSNAMFFVRLLVVYLTMKWDLVPWQRRVSERFFRNQNSTMFEFVYLAFPFYCRWYWYWYWYIPHGGKLNQFDTRRSRKNHIRFNSECTRLRNSIQFSTSTEFQTFA